MKITFVHYGRENLGIEALSSVLKRAGHAVSLVYDPGLFSEEDNVFYVSVLQHFFSRKDKMIKQIEDSHPDLVAFSVYTTTYQWSAKLAEEIKTRIGKPILFGGIHATLVPDLMMKNECVDFLIRGEGEVAILELIDALENRLAWEDVRNLCYRRGNSIIKNELGDPIQNLDDLPFLDKELFENDIRHRDDYIILTSRGCPFECSYCCESWMNKLYKNGYYRKRGVDSVLAELKEAKTRYGIKRVMFFDQIFFSQADWTERFLVEYKKEIKLPFKCVGHVSFFNASIAKMLKDAGCYCINFGVQSFNEDLRRRMLNRYESNEQIKIAFSLCDSLRIRYDLDLILGLPCASEADYRLALEFMQRYKYLNRIKCFYLAYYPGLAITDTAKELGILSETDIGMIQNCDGGNWFHSDMAGEPKLKKLNAAFSKVYKVYSLLPCWLRKILVKKNLYRCCFFIPNPIIILLQILSAIKTKDRRFLIYIKYYWHGFWNRLRQN